MMARGWRIAALAALVIFGCSSGSGTPSSGGPIGGSGTCDSMCDKIVSVGCPNDDRAQCVADCEQGGAALKTECPTEYGQALGCTQQLSLVCNPQGEAEPADENAIYTQCGSQLVALTGCGACVPDPADDDACDTCSKQNCCSERKSALGDPAIIQYLLCVDACTDLSCYDACTQKYPSLISKEQALDSCQTSKCAGTCQ